MNYVTLIFPAALALLWLLLFQDVPVPFGWREVGYKQGLTNGFSTALLGFTDMNKMIDQPLPRFDMFELLGHLGLKDLLFYMRL